MADFTVKDGVLTIAIALDKATPTVSKSGKSKVFASTNGNKSLNELCAKGAGDYGNLKIGLNLYKAI